MMIFFTDDVEKSKNNPDPDGGTQVDPKGPTSPDDETEPDEDENP